VKLRDLCASVVSNYKWPIMYRKIAFLLVLVLTVFIPGLTLAQLPEEAVDMNRIPQKAVRELVRKEKIKTATDFQHIATACYRVEDSARYHSIRFFMINL